MKFEDIPKIIRDKMQVDELIFGNGFCLKNKDGTYERIDPMKVKLNPTTKEFDIVEEQPEDWTDLKTIAEWRIRTFEKHGQLSTPELVKISQDLLDSFLANYTELNRSKITSIEGINVIIKEKPKTLSDKIILDDSGIKVITKYDVRDFIQQIKKDLDLQGPGTISINLVKLIIDKLAGEELI